MSPLICLISNNKIEGTPILKLAMVEYSSKFVEKVPRKSSPKKLPEKVPGKVARKSCPKKLPKKVARKKVARKSSLKVP